MPQVSVELINKVVAPNGLSAGAVTLRVSGLDHKALDDTVEEVSVVVLVLDVGGEVLHRERGELREQLHRDVAGL